MNDNILVFSIALSGYSALFRDCIKTQKKYCKKYGFSYVVMKDAPFSLKPLESAWLKLFLLREALKCNYKWVAFLDADCEVREHTPSFVKYLKDLKTGKSIFMCHGFSGRINSGVIFMKNTEKSLEYLDTVIENFHYIVPREDQALYENGHMIHYGKNNPNIYILKSEQWNNNRNLNNSSFIQHYSGGILRETYKKAHPLTWKKFQIRKKIKNYTARRISNQPVAGQNLEEVVNFYRRNYSHFDSEKEK